MKKRGVLIIVIIIMILTMGFQYHNVNANVANKYYLQRYNLNEFIKLTYTDFKVDSMEYKFSKKDSEHDVQMDVICKMTLKNTNQNVIQDVLNELCYSSSLGVGLAPFQFNGVDKDTNKIKNDMAEKGQSIINIKYSFYGMDRSKLKDNDEIRLYISRKLYEKEVEKYYKNNKLYSKYVFLGMKD